MFLLEAGAVKAGGADGLVGQLVFAAQHFFLLAHRGFENVLNRGDFGFQ